MHPSALFTCQSCGKPVPPPLYGIRQRNHCPHCLASVHADVTPGDRASACRGLMDPISVWVRRNGDWAVIHRCRRCGTLHSNRIAGDDNLLLLLSIAARPLAEPPVPLRQVGDLLCRQAAEAEESLPETP